MLKTLQNAQRVHNYEYFHKDGWNTKKAIALVHYVRYVILVTARVLIAHWLVWSPVADGRELIIYLDNGSRVTNAC